MFCKKCGAEMADGSKFCGKCGTPVMATASTSEEVKQQVQTPKAVNDAVNQVKKLPKKVLFGGIGAIIAIIAIVVAVLTATPTINLDKYTTVSYSGYDTYGTATVTVDWDKIEKDYKGKIKYTSKAKDSLNQLGTLGQLATSYDPVNELSALVSYSLDKNSQLSNGDKVKVTWKVDNTLEDYLKCNIKYNNDKEYKVEGLEELKKVDIFKNVTVTFSGLSGEGEAKVEYKDDDLSYYLTVDKTYDLSNGDEVTISMSDDLIQTFAEKYGQLPKKSSKKYTVEGLGEYVTKKSQITEDFTKEAKAQADDVMKAKAADAKTNNKVTDVTYEYVGDYLEVRKDTADSWYSSHSNYYGLVYKVVGSSADATTSLYMVVQFNDVLVNDAGECSVDFNDYDMPHADGVSVGNTWAFLYGYETLDGLKNGLDSDAENYTYEVGF